MSLRDRVPVEPLDDDRAARIERAVIAALPARPARAPLWRAAAPWAVAAAALAVAIVAWRAAPRPGGEHGPADGRDRAPLAVRADERGARLELGDAVVHAAPGAGFVVTRPAGGGVDVRLEGGRIELEVAPRRGRAPLRVLADDVAVVVVGTRFAVAWDGDAADPVAVEVTEGVVRVEQGGAEVARIAAGQRWTEGERVVAIAGDDARLAAAGAPGGAPELAAELPEIEVDLPGRTVAAPPPGGADPGARGGRPRGASPGRSAPERAPRRPAAPADPIAELRQAIAAAAVPAAVDVGARGDAAVTAYRRMVLDDRGAAAAQGLYGMARVQHLELGRDGDALRSLDRYVDRFPAGAEIEDVLWLRLRLLCLQQLDERCRQAAHTYLARDRHSARARLAERVTITP